MIRLSVEGRKAVDDVRQRRKRRRALWWGALGIVGAASLTGCSSSTGVSAGNTDPSTTIPPPTTTTSPVLSNQWTIKSIDSGGATWTTVVAVGSLITGAKSASSVSPQLFSLCNIDPQTDAVIPYSITTTGTSPGGFTASGNQLLMVVNRALNPTATNGSRADGTESLSGFAAGETLAAGEGFANPACPQIDPGGSTNPGTITPGGYSLASGSSVTLTGFFDLQKWASLNQPSGDSAWSSNIWINVPQSFGLSMGNLSENTSVTGPAVINLNGFASLPTYDPAHTLATGQGTGWAFPLTGSGQPDCVDFIPLIQTNPSAQTVCEQQVGGQ